MVRETQDKDAKAGIDEIACNLGSDEGFASP